jgi:hypothetical protein
VLERRMVLLGTLAAVLGCEEQEGRASAWEDMEVEDVGRAGEPEGEAAEVARRFGLEVYEEEGEAIGVVINKSAFFDGECGSQREFRDM